jgi:S-adenosylmethionine:tRNA ribosyltransferase-isomerase
VRLDDLDYDLPPERIAQTAVEPRDAARLLVDRGPARPVEHRRVADLPDLLEPGDLLVVNDSRVIPARLRLRRSSGGRVEVLLLEPAGSDLDTRTWEALLRPARKLRDGETLATDDGRAVLVVGERTAAGDTFDVTFLGDDHPLDVLARNGEMPLPPYITVPLRESERYQTVYAARPGSAAAPTAGLHLTDRVLEALADRGVGFARVELVVGLDTFKPVEEEDPRHHVIHTERYHVPAETMAACAAASRVVAVGTTAVRALETAAATGRLEGRSSLFIYPPFEWRVVDVMMTNFHLPRTTLLMMIGAFVGPRWRELYEVALAEQYRFLSFGDAMLLPRTADGPARER